MLQLIFIAAILAASAGLTVVIYRRLPANQGWRNNVILRALAAFTIFFVVLIILTVIATVIAKVLGLNVK